MSEYVFDAVIALYGKTLTVVLRFRTIDLSTQWLTPSYRSAITN